MILGRLTWAWLAAAVSCVAVGGVFINAWLNDDGAGRIALPVEKLEHLARVTERFFRADPSRVRSNGGTGLGLAIVKHVMQRHGGNLHIDSELGKGSRFACRFPENRCHREDMAAGNATKMS